MPQGRALAYGLVALGAGLAALVLLWLLATAVGGQLEVGGFILGLMVLLLLGGPPLGAGMYMLNRSRQDESEAQLFDRQRRVMDADRILRREMARDFSQQSERLAAAST